MRGLQEDLCNVESDWGHVNIQTSWKIEACYKLVLKSLLIVSQKLQEPDVDSINLFKETESHDEVHIEQPLVVIPQGESPLRVEN